MGELRSLPLVLLDPSPFEPREEIRPVESVFSVGVVIPPLVRPKGDGRFEIVSGHRRVESLRARGQAKVVCEIREMSDQVAADALFADNEDRENFSDPERGRYFLSYVERFKVSERELGRRLGVSHTMISRCIATAKVSEQVVRSRTTIDDSIHEAALTATKVAAVNSLPRTKRAEAAAAVASFGLSTSETKAMVAGVHARKSVSRAVTEVVNGREAQKAEKYAERKHRIRCPTCGGSGWVLNGEADK